MDIDYLPKLDQNEEIDTGLTEKNTIRKQISTISFEDLQNIKNKIGNKEYEKIMFDMSSKHSSNFKRANKNRPREMSSKKRRLPSDIVPEIQLQMPRDPRFDPLCGSFNNEEFKMNYKFVTHIRKKEQVQLQKQYQKEESLAKKNQIKQLMQRMDNKIRDQEKVEKKYHDKLEKKKNIKIKLRGETHTFKKKSEKRIEDLVNKYEELKKSNKLQKHLERRHKKLGQKDKKKNSNLL